MSTIFLTSFFSIMASGAPSTKVVLEFPRGRFQESDPPTFFKWSRAEGVKTLSVKIARANDDGSYDIDSGLIAKFDVLSDTQSLSWPYDNFTSGKYVWVVEGYDDTSAAPVFTEKANFNVAEIQALKLTSARMGAVAGFSRGVYRSSDSAYKLKFDTTPTTYGAFVRGSYHEKFWDFTATMNDFVLRGSVRNSASIRGHFAWKLSGKTEYSLETFLGPTLRFNLGPLVRSSDGTNITVKEYSVFNPGFSLVLQKRLNLQFTLLSQLSIDAPAFGSAKLKTEFDQINYDVRAGFIYGLFWPIGFGADIGYKSDKVAIYDSSSLVKVDSSDWSMIANLIYLF